MATVANSLVDRNADVIREIIGNSAFEFMAKEDPAFREMMLSGMEMMSANELGRDLRFKMRFYGGLTGVIRGGHVVTDALNQTIGGDRAALFGEATTSQGPKMFTQAVARTFPNALHGANPQPYGLTGTLHAIETNLYLTLTMLTMDALPSNIKEHVMPVFRGFAKHIARYAANAFHADQSNQYRIASLGPRTGTNAYSFVDANETVTFFPVEEVTHRFEVGMGVDVFSSSTVRVNEKSNIRILCWIGAVNYWTNEVTLQFDQSLKAADGSTVYDFSTDITDNLGDDSFVTFAEQFENSTNTFKGLYAWRDWFVNSGNLLRSSAITDATIDSIDVDEHPEFRSGFFPNVGTLTERGLLQYLSTTNSALDVWDYFIDTLIAAPGVWTNVFDQFQAAERIDRTDRPGSMTSLGLKDGFVITHEGRTFRGFTSKWLEKGVMMGMRRAGNWRVLVPPTPSQFRTNATADPNNDLDNKFPVEFVVPALTQSDSIMFPILTSSGELTHGTQVPGWIRMQFGPGEQIPGVIWEDIDDNRIFSS